MITPKLEAARCWVLLCSRRSVGQYWAAHQRLGTVALHHPPATRPPPLASTSPSLTSSHSTPSLSSSRGLSTSCHRPAPGAQIAYSGRALDLVLTEATTITTAAEEDGECGWITGNYICQNHPELSIKSWVLHYDRTSGSAASVHLN